MHYATLRNKGFSLLMTLILIGSLLLSPSTVRAEGSIQLAPAINESSNVGVNQPTNTVFYDKTFSVSYNGGPVCLSSKPDTCSPAGTDDAVRVYVNGSQVYSRQSYTHNYGPVDFSGYLRQGQNNVRVQLIDLMGPSRGGSPLYLVFGQSGPTEPDIQVIVTPGGQFFSPDGKGGMISVDGQPRASVTFNVQALKDGAPLADAELWMTQPFEAYMGKTNSQGKLDPTPSMAVPQPPSTDRVYVNVEYRYDGKAVASGPVELYSASTIYEPVILTFTKDEVKWWNWGPKVLFYFLTQGAPTPVPEVNGIRGTDTAIEAAYAIVQTVLYGITYWPQAGDSIYELIYQYGGQGYAPVYLKYFKIVRNGQVVQKLEHYTWHSNLKELVPDPEPWQPDRHILAMRLESPATLYITNPAGQHVGIVPGTDVKAHEASIVLSNPGDEPFTATMPGPMAGQYSVEVDGTGTGSYGFTVASLDKNGVLSSETKITGLTTPGYVTRYLVDYDRDGTTPVVVSIVGTVAINPDTLNLKSRSDRNAVTAYIELPLGFDVRNIQPGSIMLDGKIPAQLVPTSIGDHDADGDPDVMIKFDRAEVIKYILGKAPNASSINLTVSGVYQGSVRFTATDEIRLLNK